VKKVETKSDLSVGISRILGVLFCKQTHLAAAELLRQLPFGPMIGPCSRC
jgi:hypothetical protein